MTERPDPRMVAAARAWFALYPDCSIGWDAETGSYGVWHPAWFWLKRGSAEPEDVDVVGTLAELAVRAALEADGGCDHDWRDARNSIVESGEVCVKCYGLRAGNATAWNPDA